MTAIALTEVRKSFGPTEIIRGVNLTIRKGERHALVGPNGAGKTTLFNLISGRFPITSGEISLNGTRIDQMPPHKINRMGLSRSFQITSIFHKMSVFENLRCALLWSRGYKYSFWSPLWRQKALNERAEFLLEDLNLSNRRDIPAGLLSYAEQRALEIGMTIAGGAEVILLDEPTEGLAPVIVQQIGKAIELMKAQGHTILLVEQNFRFASKITDRHYVMERGRIIDMIPRAEVEKRAAQIQQYLGI